MNILFIIPSLGTGGAQSFLIRLAIQLKKEGHNVFVYDIHPSDRNADYYKSLQDEVPVVGSFYERLTIFTEGSKWKKKILHGFNRRFSLQDRLCKWQLRKLYKKNKIEVVNSHMYLADIFAAKMFHGMKGVKLISSFHGCYSFIQKQIEVGEVSFGYKDVFLQQIQQVVQQFSGFIYVTNHQLNFPQGILLDEKKKEKIYYGYLPAKKELLNTISLFSRIKDEIIVGMVARGDKTKGWEELILAYIEATARNPKVKAKLCLIGGGAFLNELKEKYQRKDIQFLGSIGNPMPYIRNFDIAALPTYFPAESLPNSVIEYLHAGKPVIATEVAEIPLMLQDKIGMIAGKLVPLKEGKADVKVMAEYLESYFQEPSLIEKHSSIAKDAFEKFKMDKCVSGYLKFYKGVIVK